MVLHRDEARQPFASASYSILANCHANIEEAPIYSALPSRHHVIQSFQRLLDRRRIVQAMNLVEVDVIGLEPPQAVVDGVPDVLARKAALVGIVAHGVEDLRGDDDPVARRRRNP
jgi:hypothetical protein